MLIFLAADKGSRDALVVFNAKNGALCYKIPMRQAGVKVLLSVSVILINIDPGLFMVFFSRMRLC